ncbi:MAG: NYN domain-containing protein [Candidatus Gastranaerophilales bacterium]|nr:NYN domain-containing protein [Candidatus Gastranaerophilales bacterium]
MNEKQIAILIDGDNISPKYAAYIRQEAAMMGKIKIFRLYGSISSPTVKSWYGVMPKYGISPILQISYSQRKSVADQALTIDAMDILYSGEINTICLVTSDSDFTKLAYRIKESGKELIGMGEQKTNESLAQACDEFKVLDLIYQVENNTDSEEAATVQEEAEAAVEAPGEETLEEAVKTISIPTEEEIIEIILNSLDESWENLANVGFALNRQISGFDARNYGYKNMTQLIKNHAEELELKVETAKDGINSIVYIKRKK